MWQIRNRVRQHAELFKCFGSSYEEANVCAIVEVLPRHLFESSHIQRVISFV